MSEQAMEHAVQEALAREGIAEEVLAAGQFNPRGHSGSMFEGGLAGGELGGAAGSVGEAVGEGDTGRGLDVRIGANADFAEVIQVGIWQ